LIQPSYPGATFSPPLSIHWALLCGPWKGPTFHNSLSVHPDFLPSSLLHRPSPSIDQRMFLARTLT
jgi:hypothetical protein